MMNSILNGIPTDEFVGYLFYAVLGVVISILSEQFKFFKPIKRAGGFSILVWFKENWKRLAMVVIGIFLGIVFMDKYSDGERSNFAALTLGLTLDVLIDRIFRRKE